MYVKVLLVSVMVSILAVGAWGECSAAATKGITETRDAWVKNWNDKQLDKVMDLYDADAMLIPSDVDRLVGRDSIRAYFEKLMNSATVKITIQSVKTDCLGDIAYDAGDYTDDIQGGGVLMQGGIKMEGGVKMNPPSQVKGEYLAVLRHTSGKWRIVQHASVQRHIEQN